MTKKLIVCMMICFCFFVLSGCGTKEIQKHVLVEINQSKIQVKEGIFYLRLTEAEFVQRGSEDIWKTPFDGRSAEDVAKEVALKTVIKSNVLSQVAKTYKITLSDEDKAMVEQQTKDLMNAYGETIFSADGITSEDVKTYLEKLILGSNVNRHLAEPLYADQLKQPSVKESVDQIVKKIKRDSIELTVTVFNLSDDETEAIKEIEKIMKKKVQSTEDFDKIINKYGNSKTVETRMLYADDENEGFEKNLFDMEKDHFTFLSTDEGYQFIYIKDKSSLTKEEILAETEKAQKMIESELYNKSSNLAYDSLLSSATVKIQKEEWKKVHIIGKE